MTDDDGIKCKMWNVNDNAQADADDADDGDVDDYDDGC